MENQYPIVISRWPRTLPARLLNFYQYIEILRETYKNSDHSIKNHSRGLHTASSEFFLLQTDRLQWPTKIFKYLLQNIFLNILCALNVVTSVNETRLSWLWTVTFEIIPKTCIEVIIQDIYCKYTFSEKLGSSFKHTTSATDGFTIHRFLAFDRFALLINCKHIWKFIFSLR